MSDSNKHTKGPWINEGLQVVTNEGITVAVINPDMMSKYWIQDSALIAAAPEMLRELERALSLIEHYKPTIDTWTDEDDFHHGVILETIAKAKGES